MLFMRVAQNSVIYVEALMSYFDEKMTEFYSPCLSSIWKCARDWVIQKGGGTTSEAPKYFYKALQKPEHFKQTWLPLDFYVKGNKTLVFGIFFYLFFIFSILFNVVFVYFFLQRSVSESGLKFNLYLVHMSFYPSDSTLDPLDLWWNVIISLSEGGNPLELEVDSSYRSIHRLLRYEAHFEFDVWDGCAFRFYCGEV